jgi:hypothetical protein
LFTLEFYAVDSYWDILWSYGASEWVVNLGYGLIYNIS